jgi:F-type H+-transporting ATPase subunit beta
VGRAITSLQAIYVPADDYTDPAPATTFAHLDATTNLERKVSDKGIYPAVDPLASSSRILAPEVRRRRALRGRLRGQADPAEVQRPAGHHRDPRHGRAVRGGQGDGRPGRRIERFLSQNTYAAKQFTGVEGSTVPVKETVEAFKKISQGEYDHVPSRRSSCAAGSTTSSATSAN